MKRYNLMYLHSSNPNKSGTVIETGTLRDMLYFLKAKKTALLDQGFEELNTWSIPGQIKPTNLQYWSNNSPANTPLFYIDLWIELDTPALDEAPSQEELDEAQEEIDNTPIGMSGHTPVPSVAVLPGTSDFTVYAKHSNFNWGDATVLLRTDSLAYACSEYEYQINKYLDKGYRSITPSTDTVSPDHAVLPYIRSMVHENEKWTITIWIESEAPVQEEAPALTYTEVKLLDEIQVLESALEAKRVQLAKHQEEVRVQAIQETIKHQAIDDLRTLNRNLDTVRQTLTGTMDCTRLDDLLGYAQLNLIYAIQNIEYNSVPQEEYPAWDF
jgi:hypothetical protein